MNQTATEQDTTNIESLCPAQRKAFEGLQINWPRKNVFALYCEDSRGRTTVLRQWHGRVGGAYLDMRDFTEQMRQADPAAIEETFEKLVLDALSKHDHVIVDDLHMLTCVTADCNFGYQRKGLLDAPLKTTCQTAIAGGKKIVFGINGSTPHPIGDRCAHIHIDKFKSLDYQFLCSAYLGEAATNELDFEKIHRFARELNAHQLKSAAEWFFHLGSLPATEKFIDYLRSQSLHSNVDLNEVQAVELSDLFGVDDVIRSLEANIIIPLENNALAAELNLKPKRGVLLAGPPGTGKTTIGRALAHRLKSKFFLLDGTFVAGTRDFYQKVHQLFEMAKQNAPAIIFIDDSDVLFENREEHGPGLYRYLLTLLDGLESESAGRVCVMMTVMDVSGLPPALVRSGRVELWLDMHLPDESARNKILQQHVQSLPASFGELDMPRLAQATDGFTGADLKRLVEDGKSLYAYDKARNEPIQPATEYFINAIETVRANKQRYAEAEMKAKGNGRMPAMGG